MDGSLPHWSDLPVDSSLPAAPRAQLDFTAAVSPLLPSLRAAALRLTREPADADDLVQEALLRAYRFWSSYRQGTHLSAWLNRIIKNTFVNGYRRKRREREAIGALRELALSRREQARELGPADLGFSDRVEGALERIAPEYRAVLLEVAVKEQSYGEAAQRLGCPIGTVMSRLHRARRALVPELGDYARGQGLVGQAV